MRYTQAYGITGVCAPNRSCLITGVFPSRLGSHGMRSTSTLPAAVKGFTEYLRPAGYFCTNNAKTDYNFAVPKTAWDQNSRTAHWQNRSPGQPFFAVFNHEVCHEGMKKWIWEGGLHVLLLIRFPPKWRHLAPAGPGETSAQLVSFVDFAPTVLSLGGVAASAHLQGSDPHLVDYVNRMVEYLPDQIAAARP